LLIQRKPLHKIISIIDLSDTYYALTLEKKTAQFIPGQYFSLSTRLHPHAREYSVASSIHDQTISFIIKKHSHGSMSQHLARLLPGQSIYVEGPFGNVCMNKNLINDTHVFIGNEAGIGPCTSIIATFPNLCYSFFYQPDFLGNQLRSILFKSNCFNATQWHGVSDPCPQAMMHTIETQLQWNNSSTNSPKKWFWLYGDVQMVCNLWNFLIDRNIAPDNIFSEVFY
jgi:ferredoxin--NADP+ reductase